MSYFFSEKSVRVRTTRVLTFLAASSLLFAQGNGKKNNPPAVKLTSPNGTTSYTAPATLTLTADATDADGTIKSVEFFSNSTSLGTVTRPPYSFTWSNVAAGSYSLTARATDNQNAKTTSAPVTATVSASSPPPPPPPPPSPTPTSSAATQGAWSSLINFPNPAGCSGCAFSPIHMHLLPNGKLLLWQDDNPSGPRGSAADTVAYVWDVASNTFTPVTNTNVDLFCAGHAFLPDGTLLVAGGHDQTDNNGTTTTSLFNYNTNSWTLSPFRMNRGRWYPTVTTLANGDMLTVSGNMTLMEGANPIPEVWQTGLGGGWRQLTSAALSLPLYPFMYLAPNGKVFYAGPDWVGRYLDTNGTGSWTSVANHIFQATRDYGSSVLYDDGKVLVVGGSDPPTNTAETIDLNSASPVWQSAGSMQWARRQMSATLLPDGKVLALGGSSSGGHNDATLAVLAGEMWNPATRAWSVMASMQVPRMYHSNALLLPDGRVVSAGGGRPAADGTTDQPNAQMYSPPYLFKADGSPADRPVISSVPTELTYGQTFSIATANAAAITGVTLIRLGSFTHSFDQNQRINRLSFTAGTGGVSAVAPASSTLCPPGHYMLFLMMNGVPSVARIVRVS